MSRSSRLTAVVVALLISACAGSTPDATARPSAPVSASAAPSASASPLAIDTSDWVRFTSDRHGYTLAHPPTWTATPATRAWGFKDRFRWVPGASDEILDENPRALTIIFRAFAVDVPPDTSEEQWLADYYGGSPAELGQHEVPLSAWCKYADAERRSISIDGRPGTVVITEDDFGPCDPQAFVFLDGSVHVFIVEAWDRPAAIPDWETLRTDLLEAFLRTIEFVP